MKKMALKISCAFFIFSLGSVLSQYDTMYLGAQPPQIIYDKTRDDILNNYLNNKPLLNYVPVYNTQYDHWENDNPNPQVPPEKPEIPNQPKEATATAAAATYQDVDLKKLDQVVARLKNDMQTLSHKTKHVYEEKLKELNEVKKLSENLKAVMQNTDNLKTNLHKKFENLNGYAALNPAGVETFLKTIEGLESMVQNINYKFEEKL